MQRLVPITLALGTVLALAACGSQDTTDEPAATAAASEPAADPNNPFADLERQMNERMMAAVGIDAGDSWVRKMIEHHQGAIDMSRLMLQQNPSAEVARMAQDSIDKQTAEVAELRKLAKDGTPDPASAEPYRAAMSAMQQAMMAASGASVEETFMRKMLAHHQGGVALSEAALANGVSGAIRAQVVKTRDGQRKEAEMTRAMLNGEPMSEAGQATATPAASASPRPTASRARVTPRPQPRETPEQAAGTDEHAGHTMSGE